MKKNRLVAIGFLGDFKVYLNLTREQAVERYCKEEGVEGVSEEELYLNKSVSINEFEFGDVFWAYEVEALDED
jgi:hypothetical protein